MKRRPRFYFAFRSPYAWMTARLLEDRVPNAMQDIDYIPYWEPDAPMLEQLRAAGGDIIYTAMSRAKHLYILQDVKRLTKKLGLTMTWPVDVDPRWELPHLAYLKARRLGRGREFFWATYRARWERGEVIYHETTIHNIALEIGLDPAEVIAATDDPEIRAEGAQALLNAHEDGVFGVPFFNLGFERFWGVDRFEDFVVRYAARSAPQPARRPIPEPVEQDLALVRAGYPDLDGVPGILLNDVGVYDTDTAGGCG